MRTTIVAQKENPTLPLYWIKLKMSSIECGICIDLMTDKCILVHLKCGHVFHGQCINRWIQTKKECPLCRSDAWSEGPSEPRRLYLHFTENPELETLRARETVINEKVKSYEAVIVALEMSITELNSDKAQLSSELEQTRKDLQNTTNALQAMIYENMMLKMIDDKIESEGHRSKTSKHQQVIGYTGQNCEIHLSVGSYTQNRLNPFEYSITHMRMHIILFFFLSSILPDQWTGRCRNAHIILSTTPLPSAHNLFVRYIVSTVHSSHISRANVVRWYVSFIFRSRTILLGKICSTKRTIDVENQFA